MITALVEFLRFGDHWVIGPEHLGLLDELEARGEQLRQDIEAWRPPD